MAQAQRLADQAPRDLAEAPRLLGDEAVGGRVQPQDRREDAELHPARDELVVLEAEEVPADVVAPPAVAGVGRGRRELGLELQRLPADDRVAGEADRVAVAADPGVARERQRPAAVARRVQVVEVVEQPQRVQPRQLGDLALLPVQPPEVDAVVLERVVELLEVGLEEVRVGRVEVDGQLGGRIDAHPLGHARVGVLVRAHAVGGVDVERDGEAAAVQLGHERRRVGEQLAVERVAGPAAAERRVDVDQVPVHVQDGDAERQPLLREAVHQLQVLVRAVGVVAAPPVAERVARQQRLRAGELVQRPQRGAVVAPVGEHVEVLVARAARRDPAVLLEQDRARVVDDRDAVAAEHALLERDAAVGLVERARGAAEVLQRVARAPDAAVVAHPALGLHGQPLGAEGALVVDELEALRVQLDLVLVLREAELGRLEGAVDDGLRRAVLELARLRVLEPEQPAVEHGDPVALALHDVLGGGERVGAGSQMRLHARAG